MIKSIIEKNIGQVFRNNKLLLLILCWYLSVSLLWVFRIPVPSEPPNPWSHFNPDEWSHIAYIDYMATHKSIPPFIPKFSVPSFQQPDYYLIAVPVYFVSKMITNYKISVYILRMLSTLFGLGMLVFSYKSVMVITKNKKTSLLTILVISLVPAFVSLTSAVTNEILASFFATATLYFLIKLSQQKPDGKAVLFLSWMTALSIGTKLTTFGLFPILILFIWIMGKKYRISLQKNIFYTLVAFFAQLLINGWWFALNKFRYGDFLKMKVADQMWGKIQPGYEGWLERYSTSVFQYAFIILRNGWYSFWGVFNALHQMLPKLSYFLILILIVIGVSGFILLKKRVSSVVLIILLGYLSSVVIIYFYYNWTRYSPQGRYLYSALLPFSFIVATGWTAFNYRLSNLIIIIFTVIMLIINIFSVIYFPAHMVPVYMNPVFLH